MAMNCETFKEKLNAYADGEMTPDERREMEAHAEECGECRAEMSRAEALNELCAELNEGLTVPLAAQAAWRQAVRAEAKKKQSRATPAWTKGIGAVAAALVLLTTATFSTRLQSSVPAGSVPAQMMATGEMEQAGFSLSSEWQNRSILPARAAEGGALRSDGSAQTESDMITGNTETQTIVLRSATRNVLSDNYDSDLLWLDDLVSEYGAYFEERSEMAAPEDGTSGRTISAVVRVPDERLDDFLTELDQLGKTVMKSESAEDVTGRYMDTQARLDALAVQKEKLDEMLASAQTVEELIAIDDKMTEVISSMEELEGAIRLWESQRSYARVTLTLTETASISQAAPANLGERMKLGFDESVVWLKSFGQDSLVVLASAAPKMVVWIPAIALVGILGWVLARARRRR